MLQSVVAQSTAGGEFRVGELAPAVVVIDAERVFTIDQQTRAEGEAVVFTGRGHIWREQAIFG